MLKQIYRYQKLFFAVFMLFSATICMAGTPRPFIIDTDVGIDDVIAMMYLLQRPDIDIKAITVASTGDAHCGPGFRNTLGLLKLMQHSSIPVACGREAPFAGGHHFPAYILAESDQLSGVAARLPKMTQPVVHTAVDLLITTLLQASQPVTIVAIGPLTNIAEALQRAPQIAKQIKTIYIMGGALEVPGNIKEVDATSDNTTAEWNIYLDPLAAAIVFKQAIPIVVVPLDVTNKIPVTKAFYESAKKNNKTPATNFVLELIQKNLNAEPVGSWYFWDPLTAVIASDESVAEFKTIHLNVKLSPEVQSGRTIVDSSAGQNIRVAVEVNTKKFKEMLLKNLTSHS